jgi:hypothetical protein
MVFNAYLTASSEYITGDFSKFRHELVSLKAILLPLGVLIVGADPSDSDAGISHALNFPPIPICLPICCSISRSHA